MKKYLITSRQYYTDTPAVYRSILHERLREHLPDFALYRDKFNPKYAEQATHHVEACRQFEGVISQKEVEALKETDVYGFASIRYFYE